MKTLTTLAIAILLISCVPNRGTIVPTEVATPQKFTLEIKGVDSVQVAEPGDSVGRSMEVANPEGRLSMLSFIVKDKAFVKIFSGISVADVTRIWNDFVYLENMTDIREINIFINSPGGDAFAGLALADQIERGKRKGFNIIAHASGIVASAAVPVFAVCSKRLAAPGTIFMVHESSLWKWPGRETASDIRSQNELMDLLRERYITKMVNNSKLNREQWLEKENRTTWFNATTGLNWGLVDSIE